MKSSISRRLWRGRSLGARIALVATASVTLAGASVLGVSAASAKSSSAPLIVWIDTSRVPYEKAYMKANPHANIKWVIYNGNENGTGVLQSKFALWNRTGWPSDAPDVMFDTQNYDAVQLGSAPYNDLLNLKSYVPKSVLNNFAGTSMKAACTTPTGQIICLRNDSAAEVLWVNPTLYSQFFGNAPIPTTWQQFFADGTALNTAHPGYLIGALGDGFDVDDYLLWANECPLDQVIGKSTIEINPASANCTSVLNALDSSGDIGKSYSDESIFSVNPQKLVMAVGALWEGTAVFETGTSSGVPNGTMVAYPAPKATNGASVTGDLGGGLWLVSKHSPNPKAAAAFAQYMATSPNIQKVGVDAGLPQYVPDESKYVSSLSSVFADPSVTEATWKQAAAQVWDGWSPVPWSTDNVWASTNLSAITANPPASATSQLVPYAEALANQARLAGYTVKSPNSSVATGS
ncbi:MAG: extracellular solute-binding protein [Solirubrobacteraceae bacterium]|jgi:multiple sugar transport system substrate-binding protein